MAERVLTRRELNRATLARQLLLERHELGVDEAIERLIGLQAQDVPPPYIALWSRLHDFRRDQLTKPCLDGRVVRASLMRHTVHSRTPTIAKVDMQALRAETDRLERFLAA